ncbi:MAG: glycosyltransferase family 39 protein [Anaerolineales bacterium]|nr:glycosyltransferase family 39 protein [Anaerolineales bacterium]MCB9144439.1 glycosyltransferase family 39 protein [Anaerolineales bacterium]
MTSTPKKEAVIFTTLIVLVILFRLPTLNILLDTDSSANAFLARQMMRGEILYDKFHTAHHLPGIYYTFLLAFRLFGDYPISPKLLLMGFMLAGAWLLYLLGRDFFDEQTGLLSAFFYVLATSQLNLAGTTAEMEHFANVPMIATVFLFFTLHKKNASPLNFIWVGVLGAVAILYKIIFIPSLFAVGFAILLAAWLERKEKGTLQKAVLRLGMIGIGVAIPLFLVAGYFAALGLWERFILLFKLGFQYTADQTLIIHFPKPFGFPLFMLAMNNIVLLVVAALGMYRLIRRSLPAKNTSSQVDLTLLAWLIASLFLAGFRGGGYQHYVLIVIPPLVLTTAIEITTSYQRWKKAHLVRTAKIGAGTVIVLILLNFLWGNFNLYRYYIPGIPNRETSFPAIQAQQFELFDYIKAHTSPDDFIYVWDINVQPYYYADRLPPIDILWASYVSATGAPERIFDPNTKYIIVADEQFFFRPEWLRDGLAQYYVLETSIHTTELYRRK